METLGDIVDTFQEFFEKLGPKRSVLLVLAVLAIIIRTVIYFRRRKRRKLEGKS